MKLSNILQEASQEIVQQFNSFYDAISNLKEINKYGSLRMREIFPSRIGYTMQFQLNPQYSKLKNQDKDIKYIMQLIKDIAIKYNSSAKVRRESAINNQAVIKIIFKDLPEENQNEIQQNNK